MHTTIYHSFWGKTRCRSDGSDGWHPLAYHNLDVAAVGSVLLREHGFPRVEAGFHPLLLTLLAWHDIGKFTRPFQCKIETLWPPALGRFRPMSSAYGHDTAGYGLLIDPLSDLTTMLMPQWRNAGRAMLRAICGHHGRPPRDIEAVSSADACDVCLTAARAYATEAMQVVGGQAVASPGTDVALRLAWQLAGLAVVADWIGSNEAWFGANEEPMPLEHYWTHHALPQACAAVARAGIVPARTRGQVALTDLAPHATQVTPLQDLVTSLPLPAGPSLVVIEDQTGAGKTEAALLLAHRMMAAGHARGVFVALPTMATANAMYHRLAGAYRALFDGDDTPSLVLAHGRRGLHQEFQKSILPMSVADGSAAADTRAEDAAGETAGAQCAAWVASDRRRAFLADIGVGTVDQALLSVLPSRHAALRLLGLSQRVLIVDEAHAYDAYMSQELETLIAFHAALGGSTIVLSATLPRDRRNALVTAFHKGAGGQPPALTSQHYPLLTLAAAGGGREQPCPPRADLGRTVQVERLATAEAAVARVAAAARAGLAVAWVRNAVDDAIEAHAALTAAGIGADLFHARFAMGDRLDIEAATMERFGRSATSASRSGRVLVATQVIEQSLDLDFDLIVSDLAPIDLLIQRAGRLWRHDRTDRSVSADAPRLLVLSPEAAADADGGWLSGPLRRTRNIYRWTILWRTARTLFETGVIETPGDVRRLIEAVYTTPDEVPEGLRAALATEQGQASAAIALGRMNVLQWKDGYAAGQGWDSDVRTPTRLTEETVTFRLGRWDGGVLSPWYAGAPEHLAWALSEVSLAAWRASAVPVPSGTLAAAVAAAKSGWGRWEQDLPLLVLTPRGDAGEGRVLTDKGIERGVTYERRTGLVVV